MGDAPTLTSGWERDVPISDTLVRAYLFHWAALCEAIATAGGGRALTTDTVAGFVPLWRLTLWVRGHRNERDQARKEHHR